MARPKYKFRGNNAIIHQESFWKTHSEWLLSGGAECVGAETRIFDPLTGLSLPIGELYQNNIAPTVLTMRGPAQAGIPFRKGIADLYRVTLTTGDSFVVTLGHRILTMRGWRLVRDVSVSEFYNTVSNIRYERTDEYFDLTVPGYGHYWAEGAWHHNTGKTLSGLTFLNEMALAHDGAQMAVLRKFRADVDGTVLLLFKQKIVGNLPLRWFGGEKPEWIGYPNKARIWVGGIDRPGSALSGERDIVYVAQAEELNTEDWETLTTRTTGRAGIIIPGILCGDCNPMGRQHFILERARAGSLTLLPTTHRDNPSLYHEDGTLTEQGKHSMERLQALTGLRRQRLYEGLWVTPEGTIYEEFDRDIHVRSRKRDEFQWWLLSVDEGYTNPAATLVIGVDGDLRLHVFREFYERGVLPSNHAKLTNNWAIEFRTVLVIVDASAAGLIAEIADLNPNLNIQSSKGHVREGIGLVHELLKVQKDGKPRLTIDPSCVNTINEFESYLYRKGTEDPLKESDHTMDDIRNSAFFLFGGEGEFRSISEEPSRIDTRW